MRLYTNNSYFLIYLFEYIVLICPALYFYCAKMAYQGNFKQFLHDRSQLETESLTQKEMKELQEAIDKSKESADVEDQQRDMERQSEEIQKHFYKTNTSPVVASAEVRKEKAFTPKQWTKQGKSSLSTVKPEKDSVSRPTEVKLTFQDLLDSSDPELDILYHTPEFNLPLALRSDCQHLSLHTKVKFLFQYYAKIETFKSKLAKESLYRAPYPKSIQSSIKCKNSLVKNSSDGDNGFFDDILDQSPEKELYVSRAGRQIKRKIYTEDTGGDSDPDFMSLKKNKADDTDIKITLDNPYIEENHSEEKDAKIGKPKKDTPRRNLLSTKKHGNRSELLIDKAKENEEKKKQQQEEIDVFEKSLKDKDFDDEIKWMMDDSPVRENQEESDANFVRRRVTPPLPTRRGRPKKGAKQEGSSKNETKAASNKNNEPIKRYGSLNVNIEKPLPSPASPKPKTSSIFEGNVVSPKIQKTACPICNKEFLQTEIENHAATCGIDDEPGEEIVQLARSTATTITCELCEKEFFMNTEYEVHVKHCIAAKIVDL